MLLWVVEARTQARRWARDGRRARESGWLFFGARERTKRSVCARCDGSCAMLPCECEHNLRVPPALRPHHRRPASYSAAGFPCTIHRPGRGTRSSGPTTRIFNQSAENRSASEGHTMLSALLVLAAAGGALAALPTDQLSVHFSSSALTLPRDGNGEKTRRRRARGGLPLQLQARKFFASHPQRQRSRAPRSPLARAGNVISNKLASWTADNIATFVAAQSAWRGGLPRGGGTPR
jgi:hypothetical protein